MFSRNLKTSLISSMFVLFIGFTNGCANASSEELMIEDNFEVGLKAEMRLVRSSGDNEKIIGVSISITNTNFESQLELEFFEDISKSILISVVAKNGENLQKQPSIVSTEDGLAKKGLLLKSGGQKKWEFLFQDILPTGLQLSENSEVHILVDIYARQPETFKPVEFHLYKFSTKTGW